MSNMVIVKINDNSIYTFFKKIIIFIFFGRFNIYKKRIKIRKKTIKDINKIAIETSAEIIKKIVGTDLNSSSVSAIVEDVSKKEVTKYI